MTNEHTMLGHRSELEKLIEDCIRNNRVAQEKLYHLFFPRMMAFVRRYIDIKIDAIKVLNTGFKHAYMSIKLYAFEGSFEGWLRKHIFYSVTDYVKLITRFSPQGFIIERDEFISKDSTDRVYYDQLVSLIEGLPAPTRAVFNMYVMEGFTHKEICKVLEISQSTSKWYLSSGRATLKEKIEGSGLNVKGDKSIKIDDFIRQRLAGGEENETPGAWIEMRDILDQKRKHDKHSFTITLGTNSVSKNEIVQLLLALDGLYKSLGGDELVIKEANSFAYSDIVQPQIAY